MKTEIFANYRNLSLCNSPRDIAFHWHNKKSVSMDLKREFYWSKHIISLTHTFIEDGTPIDPEICYSLIFQNKSQYNLELNKFLLHF